MSPMLIVAAIRVAARSTSNVVLLGEAGYADLAGQVEHLDGRLVFVGLVQQLRKIGGNRHRCSTSRSIRGGKGRPASPFHTRGPWRDSIITMVNTTLQESALRSELRARLLKS